MFSPMLEPLNASASLPAWPSTVSLPSPGSHWNVSLPEPELGAVGADVAVDEVVAGAAEQGVGAVAAAHACRRRCRRRGRWVSVPMPFWPVIVSAPPRPLTTRSSTAVLLMGCEVGVKTRDGRGAVAGDADRVVGVGARVGRGVGAFAAVDRDGDRPGEADAGVDGVGAAEGGDGHVVERRPRCRSPRRARRGRRRPRCPRSSRR